MMKKALGIAIAAALAGLATVSVAQTSGSTSGTTGASKGVMLTHRNLVAMLRQMHPVEGTTERDVTAAVLPFFHIYGQVVIMLNGLSQGYLLVLFTSPDTEAILSAMERFPPHMIPLMNLVTRALL